MPRVIGEGRGGGGKRGGRGGGGGETGEPDERFQKKGLWTGGFETLVCMRAGRI